ERKYFDSGDYALSKAGKASDVGVTSIGREHPSPDTIPHSSSPHANGVNLPPNPADPNNNSRGSPVKEGSFLQRETSVDDAQDEQVGEGEVEGSEHAQSGSLPIGK
ncbi:hypothetical protein LTS18_013491, partial [Coniosporium uncinatum]